MDDVDCVGRAFSRALVFLALLLLPLLIYLECC